MFLSPPELPSASAASLPEDADMVIEEDKEIDGKLSHFSETTATIFFTIRMM